MGSSRASPRWQHNAAMTHFILAVAAFGIGAWPAPATPSTPRCLRKEARYDYGGCKQHRGLRGERAGEILSGV